MHFADDDKRQSINSTEIYAYGTNEEIKQRKEIKCNNIIKLYD